jgi:hypothetical protein
LRSLVTSLKIFQKAVLLARGMGGWGLAKKAVLLSALILYYIILFF